MEFSEEFFKSETRMDFEVTSMMKRAWAAQMEVLEVIDKICREYNLRYFADWGTLLGAIRHKGFIPWDDDIDICLMRQDYMRLIQVFRANPPKGFAVAGMYGVTERLQKAAEVMHVRVIADETLWDFNEYMRRFHGFPYQRVGIDIFPLDVVSEDAAMRETQKSLLKQGLELIVSWEELKKSGALWNNLQIYAALCKVAIPQNADLKNWLWRVLDGICAVCEEERGNNIADFLTWCTMPQYCVKKEWYDETIYVPFEHIKVPVPGKWDEVLQAEYGDYMTIQRFAAEHEYPFYGHMEDELIRQIRAVGFEGTVEEFCAKVSKGELLV